MFEFYEESDARQEWVDVFNEARNFLDIPAKFVHERLQIPMPQKGEAIVPRSRRQPLKQSDFAQQPSKYLEQWIEIFRVGVSVSAGKVPQFTVKEFRHYSCVPKKS